MGCCRHGRIAHWKVCIGSGTMLTRTGKLRLLEYPENEAMAKLVEIGNKNFYQQGLFVPGESLDDLINKIHRCSRDRSFEKEWLDHIPRKSYGLYTVVKPLRIACRYHWLYSRMLSWKSISFFH